MNHDVSHYVRPVAVLAPSEDLFCTVGSAHWQDTGKTTSEKDDQA